MDLRAGPISWKVFKRTFLKAEECINLHQEGMSVEEYSLNFTKLSKYAPSMVSNPRGEMNHFLISVFDDLVEEFRSATLH